jgi:hypothetical protein
MEAETVPPMYKLDFHSWLSTEYSASGGPMDGDSHNDRPDSSAEVGGGAADPTYAPPSYQHP